jgi:hypothetical protein
MDSDPWSPDKADGAADTAPRKRRRISAASRSGHGCLTTEPGPWAAEDSDDGPWSAECSADHHSAARSDGSAGAASHTAAAGRRQLSLQTALVLASRSPAAPSTSYARNGMDPSKVKQRLINMKSCRCASKKNGYIPCAHKLVLSAVQQTCAAYWQLCDEERAYMAGPLFSSKCDNH